MNEQSIIADNRIFKSYSPILYDFRAFDPIAGFNIINNDLNEVISNDVKIRYADLFNSLRKRIDYKSLMKNIIKIYKVKIDVKRKMLLGMLAMVAFVDVDATSKIKLDLEEIKTNLKERLAVKFPKSIYLKVQAILSSDGLDGKIEWSNNKIEQLKYYYSSMYRGSHLESDTLQKISNSLHISDVELIKKIVNLKLTHLTKRTLFDGYDYDPRENSLIQGLTSMRSSIKNIMDDSKDSNNIILRVLCENLMEDTRMLAVGIAHSIQIHQDRSKYTKFLLSGLKERIDLSCMSNGLFCPNCRKFVKEVKVDSDDIRVRKVYDPIIIENYQKIRKYCPECNHLLLDSSFRFNYNYLNCPDCVNLMKKHEDWNFFECKCGHLGINNQPCLHNHGE